VEKRELNVCDVVQISPEYKNQMFAGCMLTVTEPKPWGCHGYVQSLGENQQMGGQAYLRPRFEDIEFVGHAVFVVGCEGESE